MTNFLQLYSFAMLGLYWHHSRVQDCNSCFDTLATDCVDVHFEPGNSLKYSADIQQQSVPL